jgi:hypothetical protein
MKPTARRLAMTTKLAEITLWQRSLASMIQSGLYLRAAIIEVSNLFMVVGVYDDGSHSASLAKYSDRRRAEDALNLVQNLVEIGLPVETN